MLPRVRQRYNPAPRSSDIGVSATFTLEGEPGNTFPPESLMSLNLSRHVNRHLEPVLGGRDTLLRGSLSIDSFLGSQQGPCGRDQGKVRRSRDD